MGPQRLTTRNKLTEIRKPQNFKRMGLSPDQQLQWGIWAVGGYAVEERGKADLDYTGSAKTNKQTKRVKKESGLNPIAHLA